MAVYKNTIAVFLLGLAGVFVSATAFAEDRILITTEFPSEDDADVIEQAQGGSAGGSFLSGGPTLREPQKIVFGPDDNLYVLDEQNNNAKGGTGAYAVFRYDGDGGSFIDAFVAPGTNGLDEAKDMIFGPDGNLYISVNEIPGNDFCGDGGAVWRFNGTTGAFMNVFVAHGAGDTSKGDGNPDRLCEAMGLVFTPAGDLLVGNDPDDGSASILRFDGTTGAYIDTFVPSGDNGLDEPGYMVIGPDNNLYVSNENPSAVLRYNGTTGAFIDEFVSDGSGGLSEPLGLAFGFDGNLYVVGGDSPGAIYRYNGSTGSFIDAFIPEENSNMQDSRSLLFFMRIAQVPTLNPWMMALLALALVGIAGFVLVRRKRKAAA